MKWLRLYHDTVTDPKWRLVALDSGQPLSAVLAVWMSMLITASGADERGTLEGWDDRIAGAAMDLRGDAVRCIREAMQGLVLDGDRLTGWDKRQRASDNVAERVKKHRSGSDPKPPGNGAGRKGNGTVTLHGADVTLHSAPETEKPLRAQSQTEIKKETEVDTCGCDASLAGTDTHGAPPDFVKTTNIVQFTPPRSPEVLPLPDDWVLSEAWFDWAAGAGHPDPEAAADRFLTHWLGKRDRGDRDAANSEAGWLRQWQGWVRGDIRRGQSHGQQRHGGRQRQDGGLTAYLKSEMRGNPGDAEGDPNDGGWRVVRG